jgi:ZIP family zinc transporter
LRSLESSLRVSEGRVFAGPQSDWRCCLSYEKAILLGAIAGLTIYLGLPFGRLQRLGPRTRLTASLVSAGILAFLFFDVLVGANEIVEGALDQAKDGGGSWARFAGLVVMLAGGFVAGLVVLGMLEGRIRRRRPVMAGGSDVGSLALTRSRAVALPSAMRLGMLIAIAIGVHNFSEGLAIGVSANSGDVALATVLIVGFALHNATEGFAIIGPFDQEERPSWGWLALAGLVAGGPTFLGTAVGYRVESEALELAFLALAAGAILYIVLELWAGARRKLSPTLATLAVAAGFLLGYGTDLVVAYAGG